MYSKEEALGEEETHSILLDSALISELNRLYFIQEDIATFDKVVGEDLDHYKASIKPILESISSVVPWPINNRNFVNVVGVYLPNLGKAFEFLIWYKLLLQNKNLEEEHTAEEMIPFWPPYILSSESSRIPHINVYNWILACAVETSENTWKVIYSVNTHGQSLNRLCNQIFDYDGPTIVLIIDGKDGIFGAYTTAPWQSKADFREDKTSFLFSLSPHFGIFRANGADSHNVYLYNNSNSRAPLPLGIGFGGSVGSFRLFINDELDKGESRENCTSFARGKISQSVLFGVKAIEVWGCGGEKAEMAQRQAKISKEKEIERRRMVKKELLDETWDSGPSRFLMNMAGKAGAADEFLEDVKKIRKMRKEQKEKLMNKT